MVSTFPGVSSYRLYTKEAYLYGFRRIRLRSALIYGVFSVEQGRVNGQEKAPDHLGKHSRGFDELTYNGR